MIIDSPLITKAIIILKSGNPLPLDLIVQLAVEGIDVSALERRYSN